MLYLNAFLLGLLQGVTELLPVSSTGHLILCEKFLPLPETMRESFFTLIQLGSICAIVLYYRQRVFPLLDCNTEGEKNHCVSCWKTWFSRWVMIGVGVIPIVLTGLLGGNAIQESLYVPKVVAWALLLGGIFFLWMDRWIAGRASVKELEQVGFLRSLGIGAVQCLALIPGVSRSGATIAGGCCLGLDRRTAVEYSFFLAIPTMLAAGVYSLWKHGAVLTTEQWVATGIAFAVAFVASWATVRGLTRFIQHHGFWCFGWYRILLGAMILLSLCFSGR